MEAFNIDLAKVRILADYWKSVDPVTVNLENWKCGTHACLAGHACSVPEFVAHGLELHVDPKGDDDGGPLWYPVYGAEHGMWAVEKFFGPDAHIYLFDMRGCGAMDEELLQPNALISDYELARLRMEHVLTHKVEALDSIL